MPEQPHEYAVRTYLQERVTALVTYELELDAEMAFDAWDAYMHDHPELGIGVEILTRDKRVADGWGTVVHRQLYWPASTLPGGLNAKVLAQDIAKEYGLYSIGEYGDSALRDWLWHLAPAYGDLSDDDRRIVDEAVAKELWG